MGKWGPKPVHDHAIFAGAGLKKMIQEAREDACACEVGRACSTCHAFDHLMELLGEACSPPSSY